MTVAATVGLPLGHGVELGLGDEEPLADGVVVGVVVGVADGFGLGDGLGDGLTDGLTDGLIDPEGVADARGTHGVLCTSTKRLPAVLLD